MKVYSKQKKRAAGGKSPGRSALPTTDNAVQKPYLKAYSRKS